MIRYTQKGVTSFNIEGGPELERFLKMYPQKIQNNVLDAVVRAGASLVRKEARKNLKQNGSVKSGLLYNSFKIEKIKGVHGEFRIFTDRSSPHAHLVEYGTALRRFDKPHVVQLSPGVWATVWHTGSATAKPFFRPALDENHDKVLKVMAERLLKRLVIEAEKLAGPYSGFSKSYKRKIAA